MPLAAFSRRARLLQATYSLRASAHPHGVFFYHRKAISYDIKKSNPKFSDWIRVVLFKLIVDLLTVFEDPKLLTVSLNDILYTYLLDSGLLSLLLDIKCNLLK